MVGWCLDNPCGGIITDSCCSRSSYQYQSGAILSADVCVDAVHYYLFLISKHPVYCYGFRRCPALKIFKSCTSFEIPRELLVFMLQPLV